MSTAFRKTIESTGLNNEHQGEHALLHALLQFADANHSGGDTYVNPYREVIHRFESANVNPYALLRIKQSLNSLVVAYDGGLIR